MAIDGVKCPTCGGPMVSRSNNRDGSRFWGCRSYPDCRGTRNVEGEANRRFTPEEEDAREAQDNMPSRVWQNRDKERWR